MSSNEPKLQAIEPTLRYMLILVLNCFNENSDTKAAKTVNLNKIAKWRFSFFVSKTSCCSMTMINKF